MSRTVAATLGVTGCAAIQQSRARDTERLLAAAGFRMQLADTAEQQQHLAAIPPHRLVSRTGDAGVEYTYADPTNCTCLYVGGSREYSAYQSLMTERQLAQEQIRAAPNAWTGWGWRSGRSWW